MDNDTKEVEAEIQRLFREKCEEVDRKLGRLSSMLNELTDKPSESGREQDRFIPSLEGDE